MRYNYAQDEELLNENDNWVTPNLWVARQPGRMCGFSKPKNHKAGPVIVIKKGEIK